MRFSEGDHNGQTSNNKKETVMSRIILSVAAIGLALALTGTAEAGKSGGKVLRLPR